MVLRLALVLGGVVHAALPAVANMRVPSDYWHAPSGALSSSASLEVLGETLLFDCGEENCDVNAIYTVRADRPLDLTFEFVLPLQTAVNARVAGHDVVADVTLFENRPFDQDDPRLPDIFESDRASPIYRATFQGRLDAGTKRIDVRYVQPLGGNEAVYGYFTTSRWVMFFEYELKPLKEWSLAEDFALDLSVSMPRRPPEESVWSSIVSARRSIECFMPNAAVTEQGDRIMYNVRRGRDFPDRLVCQMGDRDLLKDPAGIDERYR